MECVIAFGIGLVVGTTAALIITVIREDNNGKNDK